MTHPQVFGQKFTPIRRFSAWKTHPFWPHILSMTQYGSATPPGVDQRRTFFPTPGRHTGRLTYLHACSLTHIHQMHPHSPHTTYAQTFSNIMVIFVSCCEHSFGVSFTAYLYCVQRKLEHRWDRYKMRLL